MERVTAHSINEYVSYRHRGIYKICDICQKILRKNEKKEYYVLQSVYDSNSKIYVPVDQDDLSTQMQHVLTVDEIHSIIERSQEFPMQWTDDSNQRADEFSKVIERGDRAEILWLVKTLSLHKSELSEQKKKFYSCDEKMLATAEKIITDEFAFVLGIKKDEVIPYIIEKVRATAELQENQQ